MENKFIRVEDVARELCVSKPYAYKLIRKLNEELEATILMVTHDAFTASYCKRILFIKDGKIFNQITRGNDSRKQFFERIIDVVTFLGGDHGNVI